MINNPIIYNDEIFKDIEIENISPIYAISNYGTVINKSTGRILSVTLVSGYPRVGLQCIDGTRKHFFSA